MSKSTSSTSHRFHGFNIWIILREPHSYETLFTDGTFRFDSTRKWSRIPGIGEEMANSSLLRFRNVEYL